RIDTQSLHYLSTPLSYPLFFLITRPPPSSTLFPYTTLFRSAPAPPRRPAGATGGGRSHRGTIGGEPVLRARASSHGHRVRRPGADRKSTRLNSSHVAISYAVFCLKKKTRIDCNLVRLHDWSI